MRRRDQRPDDDAKDPGAEDRGGAPQHDIFDIAGSDPELIHSGRIPDPLPEHTPLFRWMARTLEWIEERLRARGGKPLRNGIRFFWLLLAAVGVLLLVGPIINKPLSFDDVIDSAKVDEVDWIARDAKFDYDIERTSSGRFAATVEESYTADFRNGPEPKILRTVVTEFMGHDARFALHSATVDGEPAEVTVNRGPATTTIRIERADGRRFEGEQQVVLSYELHDLATTETDSAGGRTVDQWSWPVLAPSWPQATKGIEVSFTLPREADDALIRAPQAYVGWLIASATQRLTPESTTADTVSYSFSNDQALPPNADIWIDAVFEPGTFAQPPQTTFFWIQTHGPLLPLALLAILLLFALAARRIGPFADLRARVAADPELHRILQERVAELDAQHSADLVIRVCTLIRGGFLSGHVSQQQVAARLAMSPRTLKRRLQTEGPSHSALLERTRMEMACHLLQNSRASMTQITGLLGYANSSAFSRAFSRWSGMPPRDWRAQQQTEKHK